MRHISLMTGTADKSAVLIQTYYIRSEHQALKRDRRSDRHSKLPLRTVTIIWVWPPESTDKLGFCVKSEKRFLFSFSFLFSPLSRNVACSSVTAAGWPYYFLSLNIVKKQRKEVFLMYWNILNFHLVLYENMTAVKSRKNFFIFRYM